MKAFGLLVGLLMSQAALAYPAVGDYVKYVGEINAAGQQFSIVAEIEITNYDAAKNGFVVQTKTSVGGQTDVTNATVPAGELFSQAMIQDLIRNCKNNGGQTSKATVPAGAFDVCLMRQSDGTTHSLYTIGDVPFGIVKSDSMSQDGLTTSITLQEVRFGQ
ncbi:MAG: hypothetical protein NDI61_02795 [Bdellovibrionaceae bacterium]|nr:hypothetical protein [Pseudobdellovibrionaceae bacterium]